MNKTPKEQLHDAEERLGLPVLPLLSTVLSHDQVHRCKCGSFTFFAWGVKLLTKESWGSSARTKDYAGMSEAAICAQCHTPVMVKEGDLYDASEFITADMVEEVIRTGQARLHPTPLKAMDP